MMTRWNCYEYESVIVICGMTWKYDWYEIVVTMEEDKWACMMNGVIWRDYWDDMKFTLTMKRMTWHIRTMNVWKQYMIESVEWYMFMNDLEATASSSSKRTILIGYGPTQVGHRNQEWFGVVRPKFGTPLLTRSSVDQCEHTEGTKPWGSGPPHQRGQYR